MWATRNKRITKKSSDICRMQWSYSAIVIIYKLITCHNPITKMFPYGRTILWWKTTQCHEEPRTLCVRHTQHSRVVGRSTSGNCVPTLYQKQCFLSLHISYVKFKFVFKINIFLFKIKLLISWICDCVYLVGTCSIFSSACSILVNTILYYKTIYKLLY